MNSKNSTRRSGRLVEFFVFNSIHWKKVPHLPPKNVYVQTIRLMPHISSIGLVPAISLQSVSAERTAMGRLLVKWVVRLWPNDPFRYRTRTSQNQKILRTITKKVLTQTKYYRGLSGKAPGGWGFFPRIFLSQVKKKAPSPLGLSFLTVEYM